jgi:hypothetical protein
MLGGAGAALAEDARRYTARAPVAPIARGARRGGRAAASPKLARATRALEQRHLARRQVPLSSLPDDLFLILLAGVAHREGGTLRKWLWADGEADAMGLTRAFKEQAGRGVSRKAAESAPQLARRGGRAAASPELARATWALERLRHLRQATGAAELPDELS